VSTKLTWFGTTRVRAGFLLTPVLLLYGTGGVTYGHAEVSGLGASTTVPGVGWAAGAGVQYALTPQWSIGAEYLHLELDGRSRSRHHLHQGHDRSRLRNAQLQILSRQPETSARRSRARARAGCGPTETLRCPAKAPGRHGARRKKIFSVVAPFLRSKGLNTATLTSPGCVRLPSGQAHPRPSRSDGEALHAPRAVRARGSPHERPTLYRIGCLLRDDCCRAENTCQLAFRQIVCTEKAGLLSCFLRWDEN
jgi:hypothetical protein